jgi:4-amino-4-deoxy-L-arabinose transferase-like glycosyltransferase
MSNKVITTLFLIALGYASLYIGNWIVASPDAGLAIVAGFVAASICVWIILRDKGDHRFLLRLFTAALLARWIIAWFVYYKGMQAFFGGDAITYDAFGNALSQSWQGLVDPNAPWLVNYTRTDRSGWGMFYYVGSIYYLLGQNPFAIQLINSVLGAFSCVAVYKIAMIVYPQQRVARMASLLTAFSPSMVLWSSQALKDAPIVLCLCLCMLYTLKLRNKFHLKSLLLLLASLFCLFTLRHYAAYILFVAMASTFLFTARKFTPLRVLQGGFLALILGLAFIYFGAADVAQQAFDLKHIQAGRVWASKAATSGFGGEVDITDPKAALGFMPIGILFVLFAPFPWMINNVRQLITLPELVVWWALFPMMLKGYWFALKHRLRESFAICLFISGLVLAYSLYQSNAGTAYRHRAQLYGFFFIFISIGLELRREAKMRKQTQAILAKAGIAQREAAPALSSTLAGNSAGASTQ